MHNTRAGPINMKPASRTHDAESTLLGKQETRGGKEVAKSVEASGGSHLVQRCTFIHIMNVHVRARLVIRPNKPAVKILAAFSQSICTIVRSSQLIHDPLVSLIDFFCFCAQADCKLTIHFSSLFSPPPHHLAGLQPAIILALRKKSLR